MNIQLTDIEKIYFEKNKLDINNMNFIEIMENKQKAYTWVFENKAKFNKDLEIYKDEFIIFLKEQ